MSGETGMTVDLRGWNKAIERLSREWGVSAADLMRYQFGLWGSDLAKKTWPKRRAANRAILTDIQRVFMIPRNDKALKNKPPESPATFYEQARDRRTGRPPRRYGRDGSGERLLVRKSDARRVLREHKRHVGKVHAGWNAMIRRFGGKPAAAWVSRHGTRGGVAFDYMRETGQGYLAGENRVSYADRMIKRKGVMQSTLRTRQRDLDRNMEKRMDRIVAQFNKAE